MINNSLDLKRKLATKRTNLNIVSDLGIKPGTYSPMYFL